MKNYQNYGNEENKQNEEKVVSNGIDKKAAANILYKGVDVRNATVIKKGNWLLIFDVWFVFMLCVMSNYPNTADRVKELLIIDAIATCWAIFEISKKSLKLFDDYSFNVPFAIQMVRSRIVAENCNKYYPNEKMIFIDNDEDAAKKEKEIKNKLANDIFKKTIVVSLILLLGSFCLLGYIRYWEVTKAVLFGLLGIPAALIVSLLLMLVEKYMIK